MSKKKHQKESILYRVKKKGVKPSYIMGTMHVKDNRIFRHVPVLEKYILKCDVFAAEFDLSQQSPEIMQKYMMLPGGMSLTDVLSAKTYAKTDKLLTKQAGLSISGFQQFKPFFISTMLSEALFGQDQPQSLDYALYFYAAEQGREIQGLEQPEAHFETILKIPLEDQIEALKELVSNPKKMMKEMDKIAELYVSQNLTGLLKLARKQNKEMLGPLLDERNILMANTFLKLASEKTTFGAVGAAHLPGENGMIDLFKKSGWKVKKVALNTK